MAGGAVALLVAVPAPIRLENLDLPDRRAAVGARDRELAVLAGVAVLRVAVDALGEARRGGRQRQQKPAHALRWLRSVLRGVRFDDAWRDSPHYSVAVSVFSAPGTA